MLNKAFEIAFNAHEGQFDKGGNPYIEHPLRVSNKVKHLGEDYEIVALLHDVVEDTYWTLSDLKSEGFSDAVIEGLDSVTRRNDETYFDFIKRAKNNKIGKAVKIEDIKDNLDLTRIGREITEKDISRSKRYEKSLLYLLEG